MYLKTIKIKRFKNKYKKDAVDVYDTNDLWIGNIDYSSFRKEFVFKGCGETLSYDELRDIMDEIHYQNVKE